MNLSSDQIKIKKVAGKLDGKPVLYVVTHGGLHAFFAKKGDSIESLAAAPHKAIAQWMAEQKGKIEWDDDFIQKSEDFVDSLQKSESSAFVKMREMVWAKPQQSMEKYAGKFLVYDHENKTIGVYTQEEIGESIAKKELTGRELIRELTMSRAASMLSLSSEFGDLFS